MSRIIEIGTLLRKMKPVLGSDEYVFITKNYSRLTAEIIELDPIATFLEKEGITAVISKDLAVEKNISFNGVFKKITLEVHSSLEAVGFTAAISTALATQNISVNVIAGYYHDHIFVPTDKAYFALSILSELSN